MHVFGKLLLGKMRVRSFDLEAADKKRFFVASLHSDDVLGPDPVTYSLGPQNGNLHELEALENCAFFDVLTPSYYSWAGRDCNYYEREGELENGKYIIAPTYPANFSMDDLPYRGPPCNL